MLQPTMVAKASPIKLQTSNTIINTAYLDNGDSITTELTVDQNPVSTCATTKTTSGSKTVKYRNASGNILWSFTLSASYTYNGSSATCTSVSTSSSINDTAWKLSNITKSKSSNKATGSVTAKEYFLGVPFNTVTESLTLTCNASGNLS